jgi:inorganic pyrophosphatase
MEKLTSAWRRITIPFGKSVSVIVDRPLGSRHPEHPDLVYPINYGYVPGVMSPDGEEQDAYLLGLDTPVERFTGVVSAAVHRLDDLEDKWIVTPEGCSFTADEIRGMLHFQEQYFRSELWF